MGMHDCRKAKRNLVDLVFGELTPAHQQNALVEVRSCPACSQEYLAMLATLRAFDQVAEAIVPEESYWTGYEARLRAKLAEPDAPSRQKRLAGWLADLQAKPAIPVALVAGLLVLIAISAVWFARQSAYNPQGLVAITTPTAQPAPTAPVLVQTGLSHSVIQKERQSVWAVKSRKPRQSRPGVGPENQFASDYLIATYTPPIGSNRQPQFDVSPVVVPASHFEQAQLLLRSFRNARAEGKGAALDLAYERRQAGKLVYNNILLRREAEAKGYLPVEEALNSLEPLLLDIANLPNKPSRHEVQVIRQRMQKQEIIATLQIVSSGTERFSPPALLNP